MNKRQIEIFSAGCPVCAEAVKLVNSITCSSCEVAVLDMNTAGVAAKANQYGIRQLPAIVVDGRIADCCAGSGVSEAALRGAGVGVPLP